MKKIILIFFLSFSNLIFCQIEDSIKLKNYVLAVNNFNSTMPYFVVFKCKDLNTNLIKEVCVLSSDLIYSISEEKKITHFEAFELAIKNESMYFEFKNVKSLERLNMITYSKDEFNNFKRKKRVKKLIEKTLTSKQSENLFPKDEKELIMFAHSFFNFGILTAINECFGGHELIIINSISE